MLDVKDLVRWFEMRLYDVLGLFKNNEIQLAEKRPETKDSYLFSFEFESGRLVRMVCLNLMEKN